MNTVCSHYQKLATEPHLLPAALMTYLLLVLCSACSAVPFDTPKKHSKALANTAATQLGQQVAIWTSAHAGASGFYPLWQGAAALGIRLGLVEEAEKSIDLQYFLMKNDTAGLVLSKALLLAADRGVRVRFLLDDIFTSAPDRNLLLLNEHPKIEVRLFNPISRRGLYGLNFLTDFRQANRRMHNKSFTVDNQVSVVGGRNIADEYFQLKTDSVFVDFDVAALGPVVSEISDSFDEFWNHSRAVPIEYIAKKKEDESLDDVRAVVGEELRALYRATYGDALNSDLLQDIISGQQPMYLANARVLADKPDKVINNVSPQQMLLTNALREVLLSAESEAIFISPYYVPLDTGVQFLSTLADNGVSVNIITNSLASTNHVPVHSAYAKYRRDILRAGAELYETRADATGALNGDVSGPDRLTLHTKMILIDRRYLFVGSPNIDPRSLEINAEMGLLIESEEMVRAMIDRIDDGLPRLTYRVIENETGKLEWHGVADGRGIVKTSEPLASRWLRFKAWFMKIVPASQL